MTKLWNLWTPIRNRLDKLTDVGTLLTRLTLAQVFVASGWGKLHDLPHVVDYFTQLGIPMPEFQARLAATSEFACGSLILVGLFTRLASIPLIVTMIVAILTARRADLSGFDDLVGFIEYLYIVLLVWLIIKGAGKVSLDHILSRKMAVPHSGSDESKSK